VKRAGRGASIPRSHRRCGLQACRFRLAGLLLCCARWSWLLIRLFSYVLGRRRRRTPPRKSSSPPLFALSLKVQRDRTHNPHSRARGPAPALPSQRLSWSKGPLRRALSFGSIQKATVLGTFTAGHMASRKRRKSGLTRMGVHASIRQNPATKAPNDSTTLVAAGRGRCAWVLQ
jgi:hypothetical protein